MKYTRNGEEKDTQNVFMIVWLSVSSVTFWYHIGMGIVTFLRYLKSFKWVVDIARAIQDTGAMIAESAFTLGIIYVIFFTFGHFLISLLPGGIITVTNQIVMITFTVLPELVMIPIMITTYDHFTMTRRTKDNRGYVWFGLYLILTLLFVGLTLVLLSGLQGGIVENTTQTSGNIFILRCFSGLFYTVLQRLWDAKGKNTYTATFHKLTCENSDLHVSLSETHKVVENLHVSLLELQGKVTQLEHDKMSLSLALAGKKVTPKSHTQSNTPTSEKTSLDNTLAYKESNTPINISDIREKLKHEIANVVASGKKISYTEISKKVGVHPNTVRKHAPSIVKEISQELPAIGQ